MINAGNTLDPEMAEHYLRAETVPVILPGNQAGVPTSDMLYYPEALNGFFSKLGHADHYYYAVIDASHSKHLPELLSLETARSACILPTEKLEHYSNSGPWLFELHPAQNMLCSLMSNINNDFYFGALLDRIAFFFASSCPFDDVLGHLLEFTWFHDPDQKCDGFFRFYDPRVLKFYLEEISTDPGRLAAFFGIEKDVIKTIAFHDEDKSIFHLYNCSPLPNNTRPVDFAYGEWEKAFFNKCGEKRLHRRLQKYLITSYPEFKMTASLENVAKWCNQAKYYGFINDPAIMQYLKAALFLGHKQIDIETWAENKKLNFRDMAANELHDAVLEEDSNEKV